MKKRLMAIGIVLSLLGPTTQAAELVIPNMPVGLTNGSFSILSSYNQGSFSAAGPVINYSNYGLLGSIRYLNHLINDNDSINFSLLIRLYCQNSATATYHYNDAQLKAAGQLVIEPPINCA